MKARTLNVVFWLLFVAIVITAMLCIKYPWLLVPLALIGIPSLRVLNIKLKRQERIEIWEEGRRRGDEVTIELVFELAKLKGSGYEFVHNGSAVLEGDIVTVVGRSGKATYPVEAFVKEEKQHVDVYLGSPCSIIFRKRKLKADFVLERP